jgi:hypothetical protein
MVVGRRWGPGNGCGRQEVAGISTTQLRTCLWMNVAPPVARGLGTTVTLTPFAETRAAVPGMVSLFSEQICFAGK